MSNDTEHHILLIEDEADMAELVSLRLEKEGFEVTQAHTGVDGWRAAREILPDLILLDLMLPVMSGLEVLRNLRENPKTASIPVIIVSAKGEEGDVVVGLHLGADDYVTKPFSMAILTARINALLRRLKNEPIESTDIVSIGPLMIDQSRYTAELSGEPLTLTRTEFRMLVALVAAQGRVLTRNQLIDKAIGMDAVVTDRAVDVHLTSLRSKLGEARHLIETVRGVGYRISETK